MTILTSLVMNTIGDLVEVQVIEVVTRRSEAAAAQTMVLVSAAASVSAVVLVVLPVYRSGKILVR